MSPTEDTKRFLLSLYYHDTTTIITADQISRYPCGVFRLLVSTCTIERNGMGRGISVVVWR